MQHTKQAAQAPGQAREDWKIMRALSEILGKTLPFNTLEELRTALFKEVPHFAALDKITPAKWQWGAAPHSKISTDKFIYPVQNFYMTDPISRNSRTMAQCMELHAEKKRGGVSFVKPLAKEIIVSFVISTALLMFAIFYKKSWRP